MMKLKIKTEEDRINEDFWKKHAVIIKVGSLAGGMKI